MIRLESIEKILQDREADIARLLWMKLDAEDVSPLDSARKGHDVSGHRDGVVGDGRRVR